MTIWSTRNQQWYVAAGFSLRRNRSRDEGDGNRTELGLGSRNERDTRTHQGCGYTSIKPPSLTKAWEIRQRNFPNRIEFAAPGGKRYDTSYYHNDPHSFVDISVTGSACSLKCEHCQGRLLENMHAAITPEELIRLGRKLHQEGGKGILISGGAGRDGEVPLDRFVDAMAELKNIGLRVIVHSGLLNRETAEGLKRASVDQVLLDVIGDAATCREIYHLDKRPEDYRQALETIKEAGLALAPHVVIGLHGGQVRGEYVAIQNVADVGAERLVLVVLRPLPRTPLEQATPPALEEIAQVMGYARLKMPQTPISLGCARPAGPLTIEIERLAIDAGLNGIAYPMEQTVEYAKARGLEVRFHDLCCTL